MKTISSKPYYSNDNKSFTGAKYAANCVGRSVWKIVLRENGNFSETVQEINYTGRMDNNSDDIDRWLLENRGW